MRTDPWGCVARGRRRAEGRRGVGDRWGLASLVFLCVGLLGCREIVRPLDLHPQEAQAVSQDPILVRLAVCWPAKPLAEDLVRLYSEKPSQAAGQQVSFDVLPGNSPNTLERLASGGADLAIVAGQPDAAIMARAQDLRLETRVLALDAVAVIAAQGASLERLSQDELAGLLSGRYVDWRELGAGSGYPEPVIREEGAATRALVESRLLGQRAFSSTALILPHDPAIVDYVAEHPQAVGLVSAALADERVKVIPIDGILPTDATLRDGKYPLVFPLVAVVPSPASRSVVGLLDVLKTSRGRSAIDRHYTLPR